MNADRSKLGNSKIRAVTTQKIAICIEKSDPLCSGDSPVQSPHITLDRIWNHFTLNATFLHSSKLIFIRVSSPALHLFSPIASVAMSEEVKIDKETFQNRLSHLVSIWKSDKRQTNDALFGGVSSMVVLMGKNEETPSFHKSNALHVRTIRSKRHSSRR